MPTLFRLIPVHLCASVAITLLAQSSRPVVTLSNPKVQLQIDRLGGSITQFQFTDQALNPLVWANSGPTSEARAMSHFICLDRWGQPSKAEEKNGMPFHGEATRVPWTLDSSNPSFARLSATLPMAQLRVRRYARLHPSEPLAIVIESITNENKLTRPFNIVQHATVGPPFLDESVLVDSNAAKGFAQSAPDATPFTWPDAYKGEQKVDMRHLTSDPDPNVVSYVIDDSIGWATAANPAKALLIAYIWKTADYPWLNFWRHVDDNHKPLARGLEFGTTGLHQPYPVLLDKGRMLNRRLFAILDAAETQTRSYAVFLLKIPTDFKGTARVRYSGTQITLQEQGPQGRIFLLNAGPNILDSAIE